MNKKILAVCFAIFVTALPSFGTITEREMADFLHDVYEKNASATCTMQTNAKWNFAIDVANLRKKQLLVKQTLETAKSRRYISENFFRDVDPENYHSETIKRQVKWAKIVDAAALDSEEVAKLANIKTNMTKIYSSAKICPFVKQNCDLTKDGLSLVPDIKSTMSSSSDYNELAYVWTAWRNATGAKLRSQFSEYVKLSNEAAQRNGFADLGEMWRNYYETDLLLNKIDNLWEQVKPLYNELHKYVLRKLKIKYGDQIDISDGLIPANILGNLWGHSWINLAPLMKPHPNATEVDITDALRAKNYTVLNMFEMANEFYLSIGLEDASMSYNVSVGAVIEKPPDWDMLCNPSAWDFCDGKNYRIKMCAKINFNDFITIHQVMGYIQYYILYKDQPILYRTGANMAFHKAVGDTITLSVSTLQHLEKIGFLENFIDNEGASLNFLMDTALDKVALLSYALAIDKWRWDVFSKNVTEDQWNTHWWHYRETIQKLKAPVKRTENDFDPGNNYHVVGDKQYINFFIALILEFQLYRGLCIAVGQYNPYSKRSKPLHKCDFYQNKTAGEKLRAGLSLGSSQHWTKVLEAITGERDLDVSAFLDYFSPLYKYLQEENVRNFTMTETELQSFFEGEYAKEAQEVISGFVVADWNLATDIKNATKQDALVNATLNLETFRLRKWKEVFRYLDPSNYRQEVIRRQLKILKVLGNSALSTDKLMQLTSIISDMTNTYITAKICPFNNQMCDLDTQGLRFEITDIMSRSTNYDELAYIWKAWRDATGAKIRDEYKDYVELSNEAAEANGFADTGDLWRNEYQCPTFIPDLSDLWGQVKPLYNELHTYVGHKLKVRYGDRLDISDGLIPAHILGNIWANSWTNLRSLVLPFPNAGSIDVTAALLKQNYTILKMYETANEFLLSLGLEDSSISYNESAGAMINKPDDREVNCDAQALDFYDGERFRIRMCTEVDYKNFVSVHVLMGKIQYFILCKDLPMTVRVGANPAFHEAVSGAISLSVATPTHLMKIGLLEAYRDNDETMINTLMDMALEKVAGLPFALLVDKFRWDVFDKNVTFKEWNDHWWYYRETIQKVKPPVPRSEHDFDAGAKYHVPGDRLFINFFVSCVLQFQIYRALCIESGQYDPTAKDPPLHKCDYYRSVDAGSKLRAGLSIGTSRHWREVLETMTGDRELDATAFLEYFEPLYAFLKQQNANISRPHINIYESINDETSFEAVPIAVASVFSCCVLCAFAVFIYTRYRRKTS